MLHILCRNPRTNIGLVLAAKNSASCLYNLIWAVWIVICLFWLALTDFKFVIDIAAYSANLDALRAVSASPMIYLFLFCWCYTYYTVGLLCRNPWTNIGLVLASKISASFLYNLSWMFTSLLPILACNSWLSVYDRKYSRLRCLLCVKGLVIYVYLGWSGSILQFRQNVIKVGSKSWLLTCSSNTSLSLPSYTGSVFMRELS